MILQSKAVEAKEEGRDVPINVIHALINNLNHDVGDALIIIGDSRAVPVLIEVLDNKNNWWMNRHLAAETLGRISDSRAVPALIEALGDEKMLVRNSAVTALGTIGDAHAVPALIEALGDEEASVRSGAAWALGRIGAARVVPDLIQILKNKEEDNNVRDSAASALGKIGEPVEDIVLTFQQVLDDGGEHIRIRRSVIYGLANLSESTEAVSMLIKALNNDEEVLVRSNAATALGKIGDAHAVPALIEALGDEEASVRVNAAAALVKIDNSKKDMVIPVLVEVLMSGRTAAGGEYGCPSAEAASILGRMGESAKEAVPALVEVLNDVSSRADVRGNAAQALRYIEPIEIYRDRDGRTIQLVIQPRL